MSPLLPRLKCPLFQSLASSLVLCRRLRSGAEPVGRSGGRSRRQRTFLLSQRAHLSLVCIPPPRMVRRWDRLAPTQWHLHGWRCPCHHWLGRRLHRRCYLLPLQLPSPILNCYLPVCGFVHLHPPSRRRIVPALPLQLKPAVLVPHHPVLADHSLLLQPEDPIQLLRARRRTMIVGFLSRRPRVLAVVFLHVLAFQKLVGLCLGPDLFHPQLLHQPVLMGSVRSLHPSFGLR